MVNAFAQALSTALNYAIASRDLENNHLAVGFLYREPPAFEQDSGWRFFSGTESDEFCNDADNFITMPLNDIINRHPETSTIITQNEYGAWEWNEETGTFTAVIDWQPQD